MLSVTASLICLCAIVAIAVAWQCARILVNRSRRCIEEANRRIAELQALVEQARRESVRLASLIEQAERMELRSAPRALAKIEALADPAALEDSKSMARLAAQLPSPRTGLPGNLFLENRQSLAIARLADQGLRAAEIARRLGIPVGEIELRLSLRAA